LLRNESNAFRDVSLSLQLRPSKTAWFRGYERIPSKRGLRPHVPEPPQKGPAAKTPLKKGASEAHDERI
jgi:hypothetical protein